MDSSGVPPERASTHRVSRKGDPPRRRSRWGVDGYSLTELTVAVVVLALGMLGLAGSTALVVRHSLLADVVSERALALQSAVETVRATPFGQIEGGKVKRGRFRTTWRVTAATGISRTVEVVTVGPGDAGLGFSPTVSDTFVYRIVRP